MTVRRSTMTTPASTKIGGRERAVRNTLSGETMAPQNASRGRRVGRGPEEGIFTVQ
jgi:hypothetical protein